MSGPSHPSPHDSLFKLAFADAASGGALLRALLPSPLVTRVDWSTLTLRSGTFKDRDLAGLESDLLLSAQVDGREALFYFLVEHQSSVDPTMAFRIWRYVTRVWETYAVEARRPSLPLVVPLVVYHGSRPWRAARSVAALIDVDAALAQATPELVPDLRYLVDDLTRLDPAELRARGLPAFATLALWALRTASDRGFAAAAAELSDLFDAVRAAGDGRGALWTIFSYLSTISAAGEDLVGVVARHLSPPVQEDIMDLVEHFAEQKKQEGRAEGRAEGRRELLLELIAAKFGRPSEDVAARLASATPEDLDRWAERLLRASSIEAIFATSEE